MGVFFILHLASRVQAAANVSIVRGTLTAERAKAMSSRGRDVDPSGGQDYSAAALSLVFHSKSPMVPTFRADVRYFQVTFVRRRLRNMRTLRTWFFAHRARPLFTHSTLAIPPYVQQRAARVPSRHPPSALSTSRYGW